MGKRDQGFSLIELMVVVAVVGVLAAIAIPAGLNYVRRARTAEVPATLKSMFLHAATYFGRDHVPTGLPGNPVPREFCSVGATAGTVPATPGPDPVQAVFGADPAFAALGFTVAEPVRYGYGIGGDAESRCEIPIRTHIYTLYANGDLDGDTVLSTFELAVGSSVENVLYRSAGLYAVSELE